MAFRRSLSNKATIFHPTFNPSFTHISHLHHHNVNQHPNHPDLPSSGSIIHTYLTQMRSFGSCTRYNNTSSCQLIWAFRRTGYGCVGNGLVLNRYMSTSTGEEEETSFPNEVPMELLSDDCSTVMAGPPSVEGITEVAIAAADSVFPVAAVQHLIDGVHSSTGLNWWLSIVVATLLIHGATLPLIINLHKENIIFWWMRRVKKREIEELLRGVRAKVIYQAEDLDALKPIAEAFEKIGQMHKDSLTWLKKFHRLKLGERYGSQILPLQMQCIFYLVCWR